MKKVLLILMLIGLCITPAYADWEGDITIGASLINGSSDSISSSIGIKAIQNIGSERYSSSFLYNYAENNGTLTERNMYGALKYDQFVTDQVYGYLSIEMLADSFKNISLRTTVGPGIGYQVINDEDTLLSIETGISYFNEDLELGKDKSWYTARIGSNFSTELFGIMLTDAIMGNLSLEDIEVYQVRNEATIALPLSTSWALKLSNIWEYDSQAAIKAGSAWTAGLRYSF